MIPNKNKAKLLTATNEANSSLALHWTGLALAVVFLAIVVIGG